MHATWLQGVCEGEAQYGSWNDFDRLRICPSIIFKIKIVLPLSGQNALSGVSAMSSLDEVEEVFLWQSTLAQ